MKVAAAYNSLLQKVKQTLILGQQKIEAEKVKIYWNTGNLIYRHIKHHKDRAEYGAQVVQNLAEDLRIEDSTLHRCVQFAQTYSRSKIIDTCRQFTWSHYRRLIAIGDDNQREKLETSILRNDWTARELAARIKDMRNSNSPVVKNDSILKEKPLTPLRGQLYTYKIVERPALGSKEEAGQLRIDLGFGNFKRLNRRTQARFSSGAIIESCLKEDAYVLKPSERTPQDLYTYEAFIEKVIDGDTLKVRMELGFDFEVRHDLRLRGIDCPEVGTKEGDAAKAFVQSLLKEASRIVLRSSRSDKYDRYLADVFIPSQDSQDDVFLNNLLLEQGHAERLKD